MGTPFVNGQVLDAATLNTLEIASSRYADATGTSDSVTATYPNANPNLVDGYHLAVGIVTPNTTGTPTFAPSIGGTAQTARTIVKFVNNVATALSVGDLQGDAELRYDLPNTRWILQNPATGDLGYTPENAANKDAAGGYVGLTAQAINFWNSAKTFLSKFTNANTAARTYTFQDRDGTIADNTDLAGKASLAGSLSQAFSGLTLTSAGNISLGSAPAANGIIKTGVDATGTGNLFIQAGGGSSGFGGSVTMYSHAHATKPGWVVAGISAGSGGKFSVQNSAIGTGTDVFSADILGNVLASGTMGVTGLATFTTLKTGGYTVATLPAPSSGLRAHVTDASAPAFGSAVVGGGAVVVPVFSNATGWIVG